MVTLENISKTFYTSEVQTQALDAINLTVNKGEFISIMGPSGCGKSTMLNIIGLNPRVAHFLSTAFYVME